MRAAQNPDPALNPPEGFRPLVEIDLAALEFSNAVIAEYALAETSEVGLFYRVEGLDTPYFDLRLAGELGDVMLLMPGERLQAGCSVGTWQEMLPPGEYRQRC